MNIALIVISFLFLFFLIVFNLIIFYKKQIKSDTNNQLPLKKISVVIPLKNEAKNISPLMNALSKINYPLDFFEIILVDDNSTDMTYQLLTDAVMGKSNYRLIKATEKKLPAKKGALTIGIENAKYDFVALTDGDCAPESDWLKNVSAALDNNDVVFGAAPLVPNGSFVSRFAAYESLRSQIINHLTLSLGIPVSATGRNFAFRKSVFVELGGYNSTMDKLSGDDDLLIREAFRNRKRIGFINANGGRVFSKTASTWKEFFRQKARHVSTSHNYLLGQKAFLGIWFLSNIVVTYSLFLTFYNPLFLFPILLKLRMDISTIGKYADFSFYKIKFHEIIFLELIYNFIVVINFFNSFFYKDKWK